MEPDYTWLDKFCDAFKELIKSFKPNDIDVTLEEYCKDDKECNDISNK